MVEIEKKKKLGAQLGNAFIRVTFNCSTGLVMFRFRIGKSK
jgi:hypothetical protein